MMSIVAASSRHDTAGGGDQAQLLLQLQEDKEDMELEKEIIIKQLRRYNSSEAACQEPIYTLPIQESSSSSSCSCHHGNDDHHSSQTMEVVELRSEIAHLRVTLETLKAKLAVYQKKECEKLKSKRDAAMAQHRREYLLRHPQHVHNSPRVHPGRYASVGVEEEDSDSDYDTLD